MQVSRTKMTLASAVMLSVVIVAFVWAGNSRYENGVRVGRDIESAKVETNMYILYGQMGRIKPQVKYIEKDVESLADRVEKLKAGQAEILREIRAGRNSD